MVGLSHYDMALNIFGPGVVCVGQSYRREKVVLRTCYEPKLGKGQTGRLGSGQLSCRTFSYYNLAFVSPVV